MRSPNELLTATHVLQFETGKCKLLAGKLKINFEINLEFVEGKTFGCCVPVLFATTT